ncbi:hypothetical protein [Desulfonema magnum]|uniref:Uncharacterized protein n=1 Tax=Desulfonema magnum TaxID=45655 RepID=A0A975BW09_9BACT|nr:hypothetical protein [Desulfonema magnum]QTA92170.1 Uncharacterized protein dnm_082460 [Desulfonema magnum]
MDKEKSLKIATVRLESRKTHRIDRLRALSKMTRDEFDQTVLDLAHDQKIELAGGDTSAMTDEQIEDLLKADDTQFVNIIWLVPLPAKARGRISLKKRLKRNGK